MQSGSSGKTLFIYFLIFGIPLAMIHGMHDKNDIDYKDEISMQNSLAKIFLEIFSGITIAGLGVLEHFSGVVSKYFSEKNIIFFIIVVLIVFSLFSFALSLGINERSIKIPKTETINGYLARKKAFYNKIGIVLYAAGVAALLIFFMSF